ncbi:disulfide oxidoreductase [soil metagenome]
MVYLGQEVTPPMIVSTIKKLWNSPSFLISITLVQAILAMAGSLYFSEVELYAPCVLCWYQRIAIYPQAFLMAMALFQKDIKVYLYALPLLFAGTVVALYHNWIYYNSNFFHPGGPAITCSANGGPSCTERYLEYFGFVSIPLMSLAALIIMIVCMLRLRAISKRNEA